MFDGSLKNKTALVTGAGKGIGRAITELLAKLGADIMAVSKTEEDLFALQKQLAEIANVRILAANLVTSQGRKSLTGFLEANGCPHIVVANAHQWNPKARLINTEQKVNTQRIGENIAYIADMLSACLEFQRKEKFGRWIGISSVSAELGLTGGALYNAQKGALEALFRTLATEEGKHGITANIVSPGFVDTEGTRQHYPPERWENIAQMNVMKRIARPEEIAWAVGFLASPVASYITGVNLPVCGGLQLGWYKLNK